MSRGIPWLALSISVAAFSRTFFLLLIFYTLTIHDSLFCGGLHVSDAGARIVGCHLILSRYYISSHLEYKWVMGTRGFETPDCDVDCSEDGLLLQGI